MIDILRANPLLLLFVVLGIGFPLGRIKLGGASLGVAAVLFVGLTIGGLDPSLKLPDIIYNLGLVLFVYCVGLSSGAGFFASLKGKGLRDNGFMIGMILLGALLVVLTHYLLGITPAAAAGLFAGSLTSTPALAAVVEYIKLALPPAVSHQIVSEPVVAYSLAYPVSVLGMILAIYTAQRFWRIDYAAEAADLNLPGTGAAAPQSRTIVVTKPEATAATVPALVRQHRWNVIFGRVRHGDTLEVVGSETRLAAGDLITVVGSAGELQRVADVLGIFSETEVDLDRSNIDYRRIFVSNHHVAGRRLSELQLPQRFGAVVTRVRRGDVELVPHGDTILELGDRVRVIARRQNLEPVSKYLGDSYRALSEIDILSFSLGLALGLLLGLVPIPFPGGLTIRLGIAGGPLIVALILGNRVRTGPFVWTLPYSANLMLRQLGLILFLAGIGTKVGYDFFATIRSGGGLSILLAATVIVMVTALIALYIGYRWLKIPFGMLTGMLAAMQTQSATLGFAQEQAGNELPSIGYSTIYPAAMVAKIVLAQMLVSLLL